jgi:hypothetical protein
MQSGKQKKSVEKKINIKRREFLLKSPLLIFAPQAILNAFSKPSSKINGDKISKSVGIDELLKKVPEPLIPSRPDLIEIYRKCWEIGLRKSELGTKENGFVDWYIDAAFDNRIFQWDTCFSVAWAKYSQGALPNIESLDNFYRKQHSNGAISGVIRKKDGTDDQPIDSPWFTRNNLFAWIEYEYFLITGDASRLPIVLPILKKYSNWIKKNRRHSNGHYYWSGWSSGMDNSPRSKADKFYPPYSWVDYDANEALAAYYIGKIAAQLGESKIFQEFQDLHAEIKELVNREMWCKEDQFYWDLEKDGSFMKVKTIASFWPMWGRICEKQHIDGLVKHLNDANSFNRPHRVPTTSADEEKYAPEGQYWRGSIWAPTNHMIVKGLEANNRHKLAREIVTNHLNNISLVYQSTGTVWENYSPEFIKPGKPWAKPDFVGWSALGPIAQLIEFYIGIKLNVPHNKINWELLTTESVGLRNLKFGDSFIELIAAERVRLEDEIQISVRTSKEFVLCLNNGKKLFKKNIPPGKHEFKFV